MNSIPMSQSMSTELPLETPIGNLLSSLDEVTRAEVLGKRFIECPLVQATNTFARVIQKELMKCAYFDLELGRFIRTKNTGGRGKIGHMGYIDSAGYTTIMVMGSNFCQSQLVYLWFFGKILLDGEQIDHIDGDRSNDYPGNLRLVSNAINCKNKKRYCTNRSGYTGVSLNKKSGRHVSRIMVNYKNIRIGTFDTPEEAYAAREAYIAAHPELGFTARHGK